MDKYYFTGALFYDEKIKDKTFQLIKPTASKYPYFAIDPGNRALMMTGMTAALYEFNENEHLLINTNDVHYNKEQPDKIELTDEMFDYIKEAIAAKETLLTASKDETEIEQDDLDLE